MEDKEIHRFDPLDADLSFSTITSTESPGIILEVSEDSSSLAGAVLSEQEEDYSFVSSASSHYNFEEIQASSFHESQLFHLPLTAGEEAETQDQTLLSDMDLDAEENDLAETKPNESIAVDDNVQEIVLLSLSDSSESPEQPTNNSSMNDQDICQTQQRERSRTPSKQEESCVADFSHEQEKIQSKAHIDLDQRIIHQSICSEDNTIFSLQEQQMLAVLPEIPPFNISNISQISIIPECMTSELCISSSSVISIHPDFQREAIPSPVIQDITPKTLFNQHQSSVTVTSNMMAINPMPIKTIYPEPPLEPIEFPKPLPYIYQQPTGSNSSKSLNPIFLLSRDKRVSQSLSELQHVFICELSGNKAPYQPPCELSGNKAPYQPPHVSIEPTAPPPENPYQFEESRLERKTSAPPTPSAKRKNVTEVPQTPPPPPRRLNEVKVPRARLAKISPSPSAKMRERLKVLKRSPSFVRSRSKSNTPSKSPPFLKSKFGHVANVLKEGKIDPESSRFLQTVLKAMDDPSILRKLEKVWHSI